MSWLYAAAQPFVGHAARAIFGLLEAEATREHADIRVDLLITWPGLLLCTIACVAWWLRLQAPRRPSLETQ